MNTCEKLIEDLVKLQRWQRGAYYMVDSRLGEYVRIDAVLAVAATHVARQADANVSESQ